MQGFPGSAQQAPGSWRLDGAGEAGASAPESISSWSCVSFCVARSASSLAASLCLIALFNRFIRSFLTAAAAVCKRAYVDWLSKRIPAHESTPQSFENDGLWFRDNKRNK